VPKTKSRGLEIRKTTNLMHKHGNPENKGSLAGAWVCSLGVWNALKQKAA